VLLVCLATCQAASTATGAVQQTDSTCLSTEDPAITPRSAEPNLNTSRLCVAMCAWDFSLPSASKGAFTRTRVRVRVPVYTGSKKHEFACIPMAAVHIDTTSVQVQVRVIICEFHSYEQFPCRSFLSNPYEVNNTKLVLI